MFPFSLVSDLIRFHPVEATLVAICFLMIAFGAMAAVAFHRRARG